MTIRMRCLTISASAFVLAGFLAVAPPVSAQHRPGKDVANRNGRGQSGAPQAAADEQANGRLQPLSPTEKARRLARWITRDDYPIVVLKARAEGSVHIAWKISILGYSSALDQYGMPIESQDSRTVHWVLPK
jgi:hypothetical protein